MLFSGIPHLAMLIALNQIAKLAKYLDIWLFGYLDIWLSAMNMAKWGIPEKSIKNVAQRR